MDDRTVNEVKRIGYFAEVDGELVGEERTQTMRVAAGCGV
jgi:hypothetical protein